MKTIHITAYPYTVQDGTIEVPDDVDIREYIEDHWREIEFEAPDLDYDGTDFDVEEV